MGACARSVVYIPKNVQGILCTSWREGRRFLMGKSCLGALGMGGGAERSTRGAPRAFFGVGGAPR